MEMQDRGIGKRDDGDGSGKKLVVKLKNWKPAPEIDRVEEIKTHYCKLCDKVFSSGKALGGHMSSAHVQASKDYSGKKAKSRLSKDSGSGDHVCGVCGKDFPSQKSLYGHMRCHPEREWRGMDPPGKRPETSTEFEDDDDDVMADAETANFVFDPQWSARARRGRSGWPTIVNSPQGSNSEDRLPSRPQLVRLLKFRPDSSEKEVCEGTTSDASSSLRKDGAKKKKRNWGDCCCPYHVEKTHKRQRVDGKEESDTESDIIVGAICLLANGRIITPAADAPSSQEKHICNICNKVLPSHQALGGHKSSHTKFKVSIVNSEDVAKNDTGNNVTTAQDANAKGEDNSHVCLICRKWFATKRALGGHRKIHNNKAGRSIIGIGMSIGEEGVGGEMEVKMEESVGDGSKSGEEGVESEREERVFYELLKTKRTYDHSPLDFDLNMEPDENGAVEGGDESHVHGLVN